MADGETVIDVNVMKVEELKEELKKLKLRCTGSKTELRGRVRTALCREENEEDDDDEGESDANENVDDKRETSVQRRREPTLQVLSFKDVEDSMRPFSGDSGQNVRQWLEEFEETAEVCRWIESRKIIYAKRLLRGSAKVFVSYERRMTTWVRLKKSLVSEFGKATNSKKVHQELARAKKKDSESYQEYMYRMLEIASHTDIETEVKIQYIIDGIQDDTFNKSVLYGASSIKELRKKLTQYESTREQRQKLRHQPLRAEKKTETKSDKSGTGDQESKNQDKRCYNCGGKSHLATSCPYKEKGVKCFSCCQFGHIAAKCSEKKVEPSVNECSAVAKQNDRVCKTVVIKT